MEMKGFIVILVILTMHFGLLLSKKENDKMKSKAASYREVIVVGGGLAGMAAARHLQQDRNIHVKILEARNDRYGGRIWTKRGNTKGLKGVDRELGGLLLNSKAYDSMLAKVLKKYEIETVGLGRVQIYFPDKEGETKVLSEEKAQKLYTELFKVIVPAVQKLKASGVDKPLDQVILEALNAYKVKAGNEAFNKDMLLGLFNTLPTTLFSNVSTLLYDVTNEFGWDSLTVGGMDAFVDRIVGGEGMELPLKVELGKVVRNIKIDDNRQKILVRTSDRKQLIADAVILAVPIGVLKSKSIIIEPNMPREWYQAIKDIGIGLSSKVVVGFSKAFWPKDVGAFTVSSEIAKDGFLQIWNNAYKFSGNPYLVGNIFGEKAREWEKAEPAELKKRVTEVLGEMFGNEKVAAHNMSVFLTSKWSTDEFTLGSLSYPRVGNTEALWERLRKPACPYLYFAGAHTDSLGYADSIHGAYHSGIRAADQILSNMCKDNSKKQKAKKKVKTEETKKSANNKTKKQKKDEL